MIAYFPEIYPDELVYSWFCRYYVHSGCLSHKMALQELLAKRSDNPSKEFIGNLSSDAREMLDTVYDMDGLVINHTMFPQYARFIPMEDRKKALYRLGHDNCDAHHLFPILPRDSNNYYLRYCPLCAAEDRKQYKEAYWHRKHQIRNLTICTKHRCKLISSDVLAKSEQSYTLCDAESYILDARIESECNPLVIQFAEYMTAVFNAKVAFESDIPLSAVLYHAIRKTKYMKSTGRCRYTKLFSDDLNTYYQRLNTPNVATIHQIQRTFLGSRYDFSVVCQIAFFLGISVENLTAPTLTAAQIKQEQDSHYTKNSAPVDWKQMDEETAPRLEQIAKDIYTGEASDNGRPERVSERLVYRELELAAHSLENMPQCRAVFEKYKESYPESYARKIVWAYKKLQTERDIPFYWSDIRTLSGVKKRNFPLATPYLLKYCDPSTMEAIKKLVQGKTG